MKRTLPLTLLLCIAAAVAAGPASAAQGVKQAKFKASISSNQVTTWAMTRRPRQHASAPFMPPALCRCRTDRASR